MARPKKYLKPKNKTITAEESVFEFLESNHVEPGKALEEWVNAQYPRNQSAAEFRLLRIEDEKKGLKVVYDLNVHRLTEEYDQHIRELDVERELLMARKKDDMVLVRKLWPEYRKQALFSSPNLKWVDDIEIVPWWQEHGVPLTYSDILDLWDKMGE